MLAFIFKFSALNVFRNRTQTVISLLAICSAVTILLFFRGFVDFTLQGLQANTIAELGELQIAKADHFKVGGDIVNNAGNQLDKSDYDNIKQLLGKVNYIKGISPRINGAGVIAFNDTTLYVKLTGIDPRQDEEFAGAENLIDGRQIRNIDECVIGNSLYQALHIHLLQEVTILSTTEAGGMNAVTCRLVGVVETKSKEMDKVYAKLHINNLQTLFDTQKINYIMVKLDSSQYIGQLEDLLNSKLKNGVTYRTWEELAEYYQAVKSLYESIFNIAVISLALIMTLSILNTISMNIFNRYNEIGMLRAIGMSKKQIFLQFFIEGSFLGLFGAIIGIFIGVGLTSYLNHLGGISMPPAPGMTSGYNVLITVSKQSIGLALLMAILSAVIATLYPAIMATKKDIIFSINKV